MSSYKYTGREDDGTGLMYYRARYYQPRMQRFIAEDPIGLEGGINYYAYVGNNPNRWIDPMGLESEFPPGNSPPDDSIEEIDLTQSIPGPKGALLLALSAKQAIEGAANACKNIRCKIQLHPPHHYFGWPFNKQMRHIELICYIKGVKGSQFILRFPY